MLKQKHYDCIEAMISNPTMSNSQLAEIVGVNRNSIGVWRRSNEEFKAEYQRRLKEKWQDSEAIAVETMRNLAIDGDFKASKYILDSLGYAPTQKIDANVEGNMNIVINIEDDE